LPRKEPPRRPWPWFMAACSFSARACAAVRGLAPFFLRGVDCLRFLMSWGFSKYRRRRVCEERDEKRRRTVSRWREGGRRQSQQNKMRETLGSGF